MKLVAVIPTYNEAGHLGALLDALFAQPLGSCDLHVLVVDDASPDGTADVAIAAGRRWPGRVEVMRRTAKQGLGSAYVAGFSHVLNVGADLIAQMDADGSHEPGVLPRMLAAVSQADVVVGSRYTPGDSRDSRRGRYRRAISRLGNAAVVRLLPRLPISDPTSGFRMWRRAALLRIDPARRVRSRAYGFQVEMAFLASTCGCRIAEIPIDFRERRAGRSKMTLRVQLRTIREIAALPWRQLDIPSESPPGPEAADDRAARTPEERCAVPEEPQDGGSLLHMSPRWER